MEASPLSPTAEKYWTEEKERALIAFFSKHNCLWNHKSESYKNRQLRWKTLEHLRILLSAHPPPVCFTIEDIKYKFKNLRTTFQRLYKMVKASRGCRSEDVFVPQWKHYQQLTFLQDCWDQEDNPDEPPPSPLIVPQEENHPTLTSPGLIVSLLPSPSTTSSPSTVPSNSMAKSRWTEDREQALIAFFNEHSCLWNRKAENHNNRQLRQRLLEVLCTQLSDHSMSFSVLDVKCKFKNLRTVFNREYKAAQACRASDRLYVSKWKHYQQLLFLCESCDEDDSTDELQDLEQGSHTPSSTLSSFSSSSTLNFSITQPSSHTKANTSAACHVFHEESSQSAAPVLLPSSPARSLPDIKPSRDSLNSLQPDIRGVDSRCYWNEAKVQQLISFYSEHSCLWNYKSPSYRNRLMRESLLDTLSSLLSINQPVPFTVEDIKTKFRNLRTIFQREHKVVSFNRTCGSEDFYLPKWKYYRELMFLCDSCDEDEDEEVEKLYLEEQELEHSSAPPSSLPQTAVRQQQAAPPSATPPDSVQSSPSSSAFSSSRASARKRSSLSPPAYSSELLDWMRALVQSQAATSPHAGFLKYVEECLNETPPDQVKKLKRRILDTIHSLSEEV